MILQKTMTPTNDRLVDDAVKDCARVAARMIMSSIPYMRFRPIQSAIYPNTTCPITVPTEVATLMAVSLLVGITPLEVCQNTRPSIAVVRLIAKIWKHPESAGVLRQQAREIPHTSYASVKKPAPATTTARTWYHPKGDLSISASNKRRRSLGSRMWSYTLSISR